jgi:hypothetical protein
MSSPPVPAEEQCKLASCRRRAKTAAGYCPVHDPETQRAYRKARPDQFKGYTLKRDYGLSLEAYSSMLVKQNGLCAICGTPNGSERSNNNGRKVLAVDHDHKTGVVRGLLCSLCNQALGLLLEDPELFRKAAEYLELHSREQAEAAAKVKALLTTLKKGL